MIRVQLPAHLRTLARVNGEIAIEEPSESIGAVLDVLESRYPALRGTIRDHTTLRRRPFVRFFGCEQDLSFAPADARLPDDILNGREPLLIVGAMAGG